MREDMRTSGTRRRCRRAARSAACSRSASGAGSDDDIISSVSRQRRHPTSAVSVRPRIQTNAATSDHSRNELTNVELMPGSGVVAATVGWRAGATPAARRAEAGDAAARTGCAGSWRTIAAAGSTGMAIGVVQMSARTNLAAAHHQRTVRVAGDRLRRREMTHTAATRTAPSTDARARVATMAVTGPFLDRCPDRPSAARQSPRARQAQRRRAGPLRINTQGRAKPIRRDFVR